MTAQRRSQDERSQAMRARLLDATVECLVEFGYAGTTVTRIAERAGVTRGAQVHHYRTKDDLVTAAVTHLAGRGAGLGWAQIARIGTADDTVGALLDALWQLHQGPIFAATVELWVAARTDVDLRRHVGGIEPVLMAALQAEMERTAVSGVIQDVAGRAVVDAVYTAMDAMRGLIISTWHLPARQRTARWHRARESLRAVFPPDDDLRAVFAASQS